MSTYNATKRKAYLDWCRNNPERHKFLKKKWDQENPEKKKAYLKKAQRKWDLKNPDKKAALKAKRRARLLSAPIGDLTKIAKVYKKCQLWRKLGFDVEVDHKIALSKGGPHSPENLQIIYTHENRFKHNKDFQPTTIFK